MIGRILQQLLNKETKVAIPGLGVFLSEYKASELQFAAKSILPPGRHIEFNQRGKTDGDQHLLHFLVEDLKLSDDHARHYIQQFVEEAKRSLNANRRFEIPQFGSMALDIEGNIVFISDASISYNQDSFGLPAFAAEAVFLKTRQVQIREVPVIPLHPFDTETVVEETEQGSAKRRLPWMGIAASVSALLIALASVFVLSRYTGSEALYSSSSKSQQAGLIPAVSTDPAVSEKPLPVENTAVEETPISAKEPKSSAPSAPVSSVQDSAVKTKHVMYFVIAGSFKEFPRVQKLSTQLQGKGYSISIHHIKDIDFTRLAIGGFPSKEEAIVFMEKNQKDFSEPLWVFTDPESVLLK